MTNLIPIHKARIKQILNSIVWDGATFEEKENEGKSKIRTFMSFDIQTFPEIQIIHDKQKTYPTDTSDNTEENNYIIRILNTYNDLERSQNDTEELLSLINETLANNQNSTNATWEDLRILESSSYQSDPNGLTIFKDIKILVKNTKNRNPNYT